MKCAHCKCEWTLAKGVSAPTKCPFCGESLVKEVAPPKLNTMEEALQYIAETYGTDILRDSQKLLAYFADVAPELRRERKLLGHFIQCNGHTRLMDVLFLSEAKRRQEWGRLTQYMEREMWLTSEAVSLVCESFWNAASGGKIPAPVSPIPTQPTAQTPSLPVHRPVSTQPVKAQPRTTAKPSPPRIVKNITIAGKTVRTDVTELDLIWDKRTAPQLLSPFFQLTSLTLWRCTQLIDLHPLATLSQLTKLKLTQCEKLTNLNPLTELSSLTELKLYGCRKLTDLRPLNRLLWLTKLKLSGCEALTDLRPLANLSQLTELELRRCDKLTDLHPLAQLPRLTLLKLSWCQNISSAELDMLGKALPRCKIKFSRL